MGNIRLLVAALALTLAACGDDGGSINPDAITIVDSPPIDTPPIDAPPIDAPSYDLSCLGNSPPTTIAGTVTVSGTTQAVNAIAMTFGATSGVTLTACTGDCMNANNLGTAGPTDATGAFTTPALATNGAALDGYLRATKPQQWTTYLYPHAPLAQSLSGAPVLIVNDSQVAIIGMLGTAQQDGNGIVGVAVTDCATQPTPVNGATVTVMGSSGAVGDPTLSIGDFLPEAAGTYLVTNVPPGTVTITVSYNGMTFLANDVEVFADSLTTAQVKPGY